MHSITELLFIVDQGDVCISSYLLWASNSHAVNAMKFWQPISIFNIDSLVQEGGKRGAFEPNQNDYHVQSGSEVGIMFMAKNVNYIVLYNCDLVEARLAGIRK
ncbi:hypothetical protein V8U11_08585 [Pseudomonas chlororaphis]|uniref:hypothetical protein n=1 Tax=Pseudomonas chlororaphis TaxID=587753 RepID=UPI0030CB302C